ncbi:serum paraoxonase/arylesterase 2-like [Engraulis encrasicolus]|uniref:serum paraoxonase/arylesterase 2-like n=1 Tax=Engraulis encrasicolus TaxID=184585 RepID=UPI002FD6D4D0
MGKFAILSAAVLVLAVFIGRRLYALNHMALASRELTQNHLPKCQLLEDIEFGAEDITILRDGLALLSTGLKYPGLPSYSDDPGKIYTLDLLSPDLRPVPLVIEGSLDLTTFNPHGISVFRDENDGAIYLFVVNHPHHASQVEIFQFVEEKNSLLHLRTIKHDLLHNVNDIVAVGVDSFYATNDAYSSNEGVKALVTIIGLAWCDVVYYSPTEVKVVAEGFNSANGINISPDHRYLYVSDILDHEIDVLEIQKKDVLVPIKSIDVGSLCDNVEVDTETGDLWLGCHPNGAKFAFNNPEDPPGSEVIRIQNIHSEQPVVSQVYADDGKVIIGSSVAARYGKKLLIGTVYQRALCCSLP